MPPPVESGGGLLPSAELESPETVGRLRSWIASAAWSFRQRLGHEWEDVQQQIFVELLDDLRGRSFPNLKAQRAYVNRAVAHSCIDRVRHHSRWRMALIDELYPAPSTSQPALLLMLRKVAAAMPAECRRLWRLLVEGYSYREMAERIGAREGTLRVRVLRCRERAIAARAELEQVRMPREEASA